MSNKSNICVYCAHSKDAPEGRMASGLYLVCCVAAPATDAAGLASWPLVKAEDHCGQFSLGQTSLDVMALSDAGIRART
jgi:hypothetical protein